MIRCRIAAGPGGQEVRPVRFRGSAMDLLELGIEASGHQGRQVYKDRSGNQSVQNRISGGARAG